MPYRIAASSPASTVCRRPCLVVSASRRVPRSIFRRPDVRRVALWFAFAGKLPVSLHRNAHLIEMPLIAWATLLVEALKFIPRPAIKIGGSPQTPQRSRRSGRRRCSNA